MKRPYKAGKSEKRFALRVTPEGDRYGWQAVKGRRFSVEGWYGFPLFTYRDGVVVYAVHEPTGLTIAVGPDHTRAMEATVRFLLKWNRHPFFNLLMEASKKLTVGPNPGPTYDREAASHCPRSAPPMRRRYNRKPREVQSV